MIALTMKHEPLLPLPYLHQLALYFQTRHRAVWDSFDAAQKSVSRRADVELNLLKSAFRLSEHDHPALYASVAKARAVLGVEQPIVLYQSHRGHQDNAAMFYTEEQGHLKFEGEILSALRPEEIDALIGHEVGHFKLWSAADGAFLTCARLLEAMVAERDVHSSLIESHRLFHLYTEIYCDRAGALVAGRPEPMVSALVKLGAGEVVVSAEDYIAQAEEIFEKSAQERSRGNTHPEHFIRARAVARWFLDERGQAAVDQLITEMIEGRKGLGELDVLGRDRLTGWTRTTVKRLTAGMAAPESNAWNRHRERFVPVETERTAEDNVDLAEICAGLARESETVRDYFAFLLLDFAVVDPSVREAMRRCREMAITLGLGARFDVLAERNLVALAA